MIFVLLISLLTYLPGQEAKSAQMTKGSITQDSDHEPFKCPQPPAEQDPLIREAEENQYIVRRVEFLGNIHTRDYALRRRMNLINEGEVFTRENLVRSIKNVSRLKNIVYPVKLNDATIRLDRSNKEVDILICFQEKRR
jgi:hypothetical protein